MTVVCLNLHREYTPANLYSFTLLVQRVRVDMRDRIPGNCLCVSYERYCSLLTKNRKEAKAQATKAITFLFHLYRRIGISPMGNSIFFSLSGKSQLRQGRATKPTAHAGCFSVSIIHRTLTHTTGSLTCVRMLTNTIVHAGCRDTVRKSALKVDPREEKSLPAPGNRTCVSGVPVRCSTNWTTFPPRNEVFGSTRITRFRCYSRRGPAEAPT